MNDNNDDLSGLLSPGELLHMLAERLQASGSYLSAARHLRITAGSDAAIDAALEKAERELNRADEAYRLLRQRLNGPDAP